MKSQPHILLIDDDHIFCMVMEEMLSQNGYQITTVFNGQKGLKLLKENPTKFDVIILDRVMPNFSGLQVFQKLCLLPIIRDIPVIILTAHTEKQRSKSVLMAGVVDILPKPVDEKRLILTIEKALKDKIKVNT